MTWVDWAFVAIGLVVAGLGARATWQIVRANSLSASQKLLQVLFVWAVPVIGAVVVGHLLTADRSRAPSKLDEQERSEPHPYVTQALEQNVRLAARAAHSTAVTALIDGASEATGNGSEPESD